MKYVQKQAAPAFFTEHTQGLTQWQQYGSQGEKRELKTFILAHEQFDLCVYCECRVRLNDSHLEHIKPKAQQMYPELTFVYDNLVVSCNGVQYNPQETAQNRHCGHKKLNQYDETLFLDPTVIIDISDYFQFDQDEYTIEPSAKQPAQANYTINILRLNSAGLILARQNALNTLQSKLRGIKNVKQRKQKLLNYLNKNSVPFISYLRYRFRHLLI